MEPTSENTFLSLDKPLQQQIDALARAQGVSPAEVIRRALTAGERPPAPLRQRASSDALFERARRISEGAPSDTWKELPRDLAMNFDHYHYGHPREGE